MKKVSPVKIAKTVPTTIARPGVCNEFNDVCK